MAGVVGIRKFAYDIWGDTVNVAARMEQQSEANCINISESTYQLVKDHIPCIYRGKIAAKNLAARNMYFVQFEKRQSNIDILMRRGSKRREELQELLSDSLHARLGLSPLVDDFSDSDEESSS